MSQKEKLIRQYFALKHRFDLNEPGCSKVCPSEPTPADIRDMSKEFKVMDLEYKISAVESSLRQQAVRIERENYFATEEGKKAKENAENEKANLWVQHKNLMIELENWLNNELHYLCGDNWLCTVNSGYKSINFEIGVKNKNPERPGAVFEFGHSFDVYFDLYNFDKPEPRFEMNYGCLGSFDLFTDTYRSEYLEGQGKFANNKKLLQDLFDKCMDIEKQNDVIKNRIREIDSFLENPLNNK